MIVSEFIQGTDEWKAIRVGKASGTRIAGIITPAKLEISKSREDLILKMIDENVTGISAESTFKNDIMERGNIFEADAKAEYTKITGIEIYSYGLCISDTNPLHACSPDGFNEDETIGVEIKCPQGVNHLKYIKGHYIETVLKKKKKDTDEDVFESVKLGSSIYEDYKPQCINYFLVNPKLQRLDTVSYRPEFYPNPIHIESIYREDIAEDIAKVDLALTQFFKEYEIQYNNYIF